MLSATKPTLVTEPIVTTVTKNEQALKEKLREQELLFSHTSQLIEAEGEGMSARRQGMLDRTCPYNQFAASSAQEREMAYAWSTGWEMCDEEMKSLNVLTTARDFADALDMNCLDEHCQHLFRVMQHALRAARSLTE